ncbi:procyclin-associated gene 1 (PAG1) polypeptide [Trypanosoma brucei brucei TREU927]|uniref:Procyclin-associated gene 1 (PAG1) polypeptide n=1 Tax=Trypanosoma brucei brucei (strain 927/4 GUTat10.1) TaxID=185431 RepID=Q389V3_TRYB2|nr:procyclin-associated gene 1 polypeptide [Trypanosoma brucei brucei TREU927]EAN78417.1 procyclin-associated gene 1 (PAG1) polypeptide [Trypanosoma brucei brucei TREU927]
MVSLIILFRLTFAIANRVRTLMKVLVIVSFFVLTGSASADSGALSLSGAAEALCNASKRLKSVYAFVQAKTKYATEKVREFEDMVELVRLKIVRVRGNEGGNSNWTSCTGIAKFLKRVGSKVNRVKRRELKRLRYLGYSAVGAAGIAAGRLDEMINVWRRAYSSGKGDFCVGNSEHHATRNQLLNCYLSDSEKDEFISLGDMHRMERVEEMNMTRESMNELLRLTGGGGNPLERYVHSANCHLTNTRPGGGYLSENSTSRRILWGDGIISLKRSGRGFVGGTGKTRAEVLIHDVTWEEDPVNNVPVLRNAYRELRKFVNLYTHIEELAHETGAHWNWEYAQAIVNTGTHGNKSTVVVDEDSGKSFVVLGNRETVQEEKLLEEMAMCGVGRIGSLRRTLALLFLLF